MTAALAACLIAASAAVANEKTVPSWMTWNAGKKLTEIQLKAAYNGNNGSWNYNGYYEGGITIVVPVKTTVLIKFWNPDGNYPHSFMVTRPFPEGEFPDMAGRDEVAVSRAYSKSPAQGCHSCKEDIRFKAKKAGRYYFYCGVVGHGPAGMWVRFEISETTETPYATLAEGVPAEGDEPPWQ